MNINDYLKEMIAMYQLMLTDATLIPKLDEIVAMLKICFEKGNKILIAGNGGSATDAEHFAAEIVGRYKLERKGYPAMALGTSGAILTAWSNDKGYDSVFARQLEAFAKPDDIFIGISTSGNSESIVQAVEQAQKMNVKTICLLGKNGGKLRDMANVSIVVPSDETSHCQECHIAIIHYVCDAVEGGFLP